MFIQTQPTPNPLTLKFLPGVTVMPDGTRFYTSPEEAKHSPLAEALFAVAKVTAVFLGADFISVTREEDVPWEVLKPALLTTIMEHLVSGRPVVTGAAEEESGEANADSEDSDVVRQIKELIETRVRPAVAQDGGDIVYRGFHDGIVSLELHGACSGCPSSTATLKSGIENMLKHYVPEVVAVEAV
ncbi:MAG: NifU family protein [Alphaproteobacteria bacterium]|nr:NifU family protein [Alphaproteobacteria bacterium]